MYEYVLKFNFIISFTIMKRTVFLYFYIFFFSPKTLIKYTLSVICEAERVQLELVSDQDPVPKSRALARPR